MGSVILFSIYRLIVMKMWVLNVSRSKLNENFCTFGNSQSRWTRPDINYRVEKFLSGE